MVFIKNVVLKNLAIFTWVESIYKKLIKRDFTKKNLQHGSGGERGGGRGGRGGKGRGRGGGRGGRVY